MSYTKTIWKNRQVEHPRRYTLVNTDGKTILSPEPGTVFEEGTPLNADNMQHIEDGIEAAAKTADTARDACQKLEIRKLDKTGGDLTGQVSMIRSGKRYALLDESNVRGALTAYAKKVETLPIKGGTLTGPVDAPTIKESGVKLSEKYAAKVHEHKASDITNIRDYIRDTFFPVGEIWQSTDPTSPAAIVGGTWEAIESGRFLVAAGGDYAVESKGGAASVSLTGEQNGPHNHMVNWNFTFGPDGSGGYTTVSNGFTPSRISTTSSGSGAPHENRPPYYAVYMWRRIA